MKHLLLLARAGAPNLLEGDVPSWGGSLVLAYRSTTGGLCRECGAELRWSVAPTEQTDSMYVCSADWRHNGYRDMTWSDWRRTRSLMDLSRETEWALPLVFDGQPIPCNFYRAAVEARAIANPLVFCTHITPEDALALTRVGEEAGLWKRLIVDP